MPYKMQVTIPRITSVTIADFEARAPGLSNLVTIPLVHSGVEAADIAESITNRKLPSHESVAKVETITETGVGWVVALRITGD